MATQARSGSRDGQGLPTGDRRRDDRQNSAPPSRPRRISPFLVAVLILITAFGVARSVGPLSEFREARSERADLEAQVALLEQENEAVRSENDRLGHDTYLEALARSELNLARPGEDVFIVTGLPTTTTPTIPEPAPVEPGPLEKMVSSLRRLF
ncbi:MAG: FtsB family cell division protein [Thermoleophilia bacterium]